jgi:hypothetical protein
MAPRKGKSELYSYKQALEMVRIAVEVGREVENTNRHGYPTTLSETTRRMTPTLSETTRRMTPYRPVFEKLFKELAAQESNRPFGRYEFTIPRK